MSDQKATDSETPLPVQGEAYSRLKLAKDILKKAGLTPVDFKFLSYDKILVMAGLNDGK